MANRIFQNGELVTVEAPSKAGHAAPQQQQSPAAAMAALQQGAGNAAVAKAVQSRQREAPAEPAEGEQA